MMMLSAQSAFAFAPVTPCTAWGYTTCAVRMDMATTEALPTGAAFAKTLPGVTAPMGYFDPLGLADELPAEEMLKWREAELAHARVSMVAGLGFLVQESFHPIFPDIGGPAARQLDLVLQTENGQAICASLLFGIMLTEITRAKIGWQDPNVAMQELLPTYTPGDLGFDPLGLTKDMGEAELLKMKNKELNNGRLAMIAVAGICAQEVISGQELLGSA